MASAGPNSPLSGADDATIGDMPWITPGNVTACDGTETFTAFGVGLTISHYLVATNFQFNIGDTQVVEGIEVFVTKESGAEIVTDKAVWLVLGGVFGNNLGDFETPWPGTPTVFTYGSQFNMWGFASLTGLDVKGASCQVWLACQSDDINAIAFVDCIRVKVYYHAPVTGTTGQRFGRLSLVRHIPHRLIPWIDR